MSSAVLIEGRHLKNANKNKNNLKVASQPAFLGRCFHGHSRICITNILAQIPSEHRQVRDYKRGIFFKKKRSS